MSGEKAAAGDPFTACQNELQAFNQFVLHGQQGLLNQPLKLLGVDPTLVKSVIDALQEFPDHNVDLRFLPPPRSLPR
jgi:hypothetical protein